MSGNTAICCLVAVETLYCIQLLRSELNYMVTADIWGGGGGGGRSVLYFLYKSCLSDAYIVWCAKI